MMDFKVMQTYLERLKSEIAPALGCTEPAAAALTSAYAASKLDEPVCRLEVAVSQYILKNGMNVGIPGTGMTGLDIACALGAIIAKPEDQLMVLSGLTDSQKDMATEMVRDKRVKISLADTTEKIYISVTAIGESSSTNAVISGTHTSLTRLTKDGQILFSENTDSSEQSSPIQPLPEVAMNLDDIISFSREVPLEQLEFLRDLIELNTTIAVEGLTQDYGLKVGKSMLEGGGLISGDVGNYAVALTAAAADARMAGCDKPVMSAAGSGNQGLTATLPVAAVGRKLRIPEEKVLRSLAMSILVTVHTKRHIGRLSVLCGCSIAAAIGACCGIISMMDGTNDNIKAGVSNMVADISGVICDGAKPGCALKIATAVSSAIRAANMALLGANAGIQDGIVTDDVEKTLANLGKLGNEGMSGTNGIILDMMLQKN